MRDSTSVIFTLYKHPEDYPDNYVVRRYRVFGSERVALGNVVLCDSLESARMVIRSPEDNSAIVESWL